MVRLIIIFSFLLVSPGIYAQEGPRTINFPKQTAFPEKIPASANVWVFIMAGQSNMAGRGFVEPSDTISHPRILTIDRNNQVILAKEPLHFYEPSMAGLDCGLSFARTLIGNIPDSVSVLVIPAAVGGSSIDQWLGDSIHRSFKLLTNFREKVILGSRYGDIKGILWHQGESDAKAELIPSYQEKLQKLFSLFRGYASNPNLMVITGQVGEFPDDARNKVLINKIIRRHAAADPNTYMVKTSDLKHKGDKLHFNSESQRIMGERMAKTFLKKYRKSAK